MAQDRVNMQTFETIMLQPSTDGAFRNVSDDPMLCSSRFSKSSDDFMMQFSDQTAFNGDTSRMSIVGTPSTSDLALLAHSNESQTNDPPLPTQDIAMEVSGFSMQFETALTSNPSMHVPILSNDSSMGNALLTTLSDQPTLMPLGLSNGLGDSREGGFLGGMVTDSPAGAILMSPSPQMPSVSGPSQASSDPHVFMSHDLFSAPLFNVEDALMLQAAAAATATRRPHHEESVMDGIPVLTSVLPPASSVGGMVSAGIEDPSLTGESIDSTLFPPLGEFASSFASFGTLPLPSAPSQSPAQPYVGFNAVPRNTAAMYMVDSTPSGLTDGRFASFPRTRTRTKVAPPPPVSFLQQQYQQEVTPIGMADAFHPGLGMAMGPDGSLAMIAGTPGGIAGMKIQGERYMSATAPALVGTMSASGSSEGLGGDWKVPGAPGSSVTEDFAVAAAKLVASLTPEQRMSLAALAAAGAAVPQRTEEAKELPPLPPFAERKGAAVPNLHSTHNHQEGKGTSSIDLRGRSSTPKVPYNVTADSAASEHSASLLPGMGNTLKQRSRSRQNLLGMIMPSGSSNASQERRPNSTSPPAPSTGSSPETAPTTSTPDAPNLQRFPMLAAKAAAAFEAAVRKAKGGSSKTSSSSSSSPSSSAIPSASSKPLSRLYHGRQAGSSSHTISASQSSSSRNTSAAIDRGESPSGSHIKKERQDDEDMIHSGASRGRASRGRTLELARNLDEFRSSDEVKSRGAKEEEGDALDLLYQHVRKVASSGGLSGSTACGPTDVDHTQEVERRAPPISTEISSEEEEEPFYLPIPSGSAFAAIGVQPAESEGAAVNVVAGPSSGGSHTSAQTAVKTPDLGYRLSDVIGEDDEDDDEAEEDDFDDLDSLEGFSDEDEFDYDAMSVSSVVTSVGSPFDDDWNNGFGSPGMRSRPPSGAMSGSNVGIVGAGVKRRVSKLSRLSNASGQSRDRMYGARRMRPSSGYSRMSIIEGGASCEPSSEDIRRLSQLQLEASEDSIMGDRPPSQDVSQKCYVFVNETGAFAATLPSQGTSMSSVDRTTSSRFNDPKEEPSATVQPPPKATPAPPKPPPRKDSMQHLKIDGLFFKPAATSVISDPSLPPLPASAMGDSQNLTRSSNTNSTIVAAADSPTNNGMVSAMAAAATAANPGQTLTMPMLPSTATAISAEPIAGSHQLPGCLHLRVVGVIKYEDKAGEVLEILPDGVPSDRVVVQVEGERQGLVKGEAEAEDVDVQRSVFACSCGKFFHDISNLKIHHKTHVEKPFICDICERRYQNSERTFRDAEAALMAYNGIIPKMDTFTHDNGTNAVLLCLHGTVPVTFRGVTYNIPIAVWIPSSYPAHPPMSYVTPTATMLVRMSKHVDLAGKIYHPMLAVWHTKTEESNLIKLLGVFQEIFSIEPPVYAKPAGNQTSARPSSLTRSNPINVGNASPPQASNIQATISRSPATPPPVPPNPYAQSRASSPAANSQPNNSNPPSSNHPMGIPSHRPMSPHGSMSASPPQHGNISLYSASHIQGRVGSYPGSAGTSPLAGHQQLSAPMKPKTPVDPQEAKAQALRVALRDRILTAETSRRARLATDHERLVGINRRLNEGDARLRDLMRRLEDEKAKVKNSTDILVAKNTEIRGFVDQLSAEPEVSVDDLLEGGTVVYNQLYDVVADEHALDDTIYVLGQALNSEVVPLPTFMKVREEGFLKSFLTRFALSI
ncbi:hypothetical protein HDU67_010306 [Dinochytrium kinnereticum]|nr:hypothetical protein HDU67_010306 [Dinochytrium kinnereticum]